MVSSAPLVGKGLNPKIAQITWQNPGKPFGMSINFSMKLPTADRFDQAP
jgi:hypothetical protein